MRHVHPTPSRGAPPALPPHSPRPNPPSTTPPTAYDTLTVKAGSTTVATFSNLNHNTGYSLKSFTAPAGTTSVSFTATDDSSLQTSFVIDDTAFTAS